MNRIRIATTNQGKLRELRQMLTPLGFDVVGMDDLDLEVEETGATFAENALLKAEAVARLTGELAVADDSGLEVEALGNRPGIHSARYSGVVGADRDRANRVKLLEEMADVEDRRARFVCAMALVEPGREPLVFRGVLEGTIGRDERGENGFGYDPVFVVPEDGRTTAELSPNEKNAISHRGRALRALVEHLRARG